MTHTSTTLQLSVSTQCKVTPIEKFDCNLLLGKAKHIKSLFKTEGPEGHLDCHKFTKYI